MLPWLNRAAVSSHIRISSLEAWRKNIQFTNKHDFSHIVLPSRKRNGIKVTICSQLSLHWNYKVSWDRFELAVPTVGLKPGTGLRVLAAYPSVFAPSFPADQWRPGAACAWNRLALETISWKSRYVFKSDLLQGWLYQTSVWVSISMRGLSNSFVSQRVIASKCSCLKV